MSTLTKQVVGDELYLYNAKGECIFKRWLNQGCSMVFDLMSYGKNTLVSITEENGQIKFTENEARA